MMKFNTLTNSVSIFMVISFTNLAIAANQRGSVRRQRQRNNSKAEDVNNPKRRSLWEENDQHDSGGYYSSSSSSKGKGKGKGTSSSSSSSDDNKHLPTPPYYGYPTPANPPHPYHPPYHQPTPYPTQYIPPHHRPPYHPPTPYHPNPNTPTDHIPCGSSYIPIDLRDTLRCCDDETGSAGKACCGKIGFDPHSQICCDNQSVVQYGWHCPTPTNPSTPYQPPAPTPHPTYQQYTPPNPTYDPPTPPIPPPPTCNYGYKQAKITLEIIDAVAIGMGFHVGGNLSMSDIVVSADPIWDGEFGRDVATYSGVVDSGRYTLVHEEICLVAQRCYSLEGKVHMSPLDLSDPAYGGYHANSVLFRIAVSFTVNFEVKWDGEVKFQQHQTVIPNTNSGTSGLYANFGDICEI